MTVVIWHRMAICQIKNHSLIVSRSATWCRKRLKITKVWRKLEEATRAIVTKQKQDVYVVTGPVFEVTSPNDWAGCDCTYRFIKRCICQKLALLGLTTPNNNLQQVKVVSVCYIEEKLGINLFPQLTEQQKRNVYRLPLTASQVKPNQKLDYLHWDGESQCEQDLSAEQIQALQDQFKSKKLVLLNRWKQKFQVLMKKLEMPL